MGVYATLLYGLHAPLSLSYASKELFSCGGASMSIFLIEEDGGGSSDVGWILPYYHWW